MNVPFVDLKAQYLTIRSEINRAIQEVIESSAYIGGKPVNDFENSFSRLYKVNNVISCANGTDSLYIIMKMLGIGPGDEVITTAFSWISSSETISQTGAMPVFVDIDPDYYTIDESLLEAAITSKTRAMIAVHLYGQICAIDTISHICKNYGIALIEDCAQSHLSELEGIRAGMMGIAGSFSFYPGKNLGAYGDAGCIITNDDDFAVKCRMFARHGALVKHQHQIEGINSRMDGLQAAILSAKLPHILQWTERRIQIASEYNQLLKDIPGIVVPLKRPGSVHTYHLYVIRAEKRDQLLHFLKEKGIDCAIHYPKALPLLECYKHLGLNPAMFPVSSKYQSEILSLPIFPEITGSQISYVVQSIRNFYSK